MRNFLPAIMMMTSASAMAAGIDYNGKPVPPLCVKAITVDINGDHNALSIPLDKTLYRGCFNSNVIRGDFEVEGAALISKVDGGTFSYEVVTKIDAVTYLLKAVETTSGTFTSSSYVVVAVEPVKFLKSADTAQRPAWQTIKALVFKGEFSTAETTAEKIIAAYKAP